MHMAQLRRKSTTRRKAAKQSGFTDGLFLPTLHAALRLFPALLVRTGRRGRTLDDWRATIDKHIIRSAVLKLHAIYRGFGRLSHFPWYECPSTLNPVGRLSVGAERSFRPELTWRLTNNTSCPWTVTENCDKIQKDAILPSPWQSAQLRAWRPEPRLWPEGRRV